MARRRADPLHWIADVHLSTTRASWWLPRSIYASVFSDRSFQIRVEELARLEQTTLEFVGGICYGRGVGGDGFLRSAALDVLGVLPLAPYLARILLVQQEKLPEHVFQAMQVAYGHRAFALWQMPLRMESPTRPRGRRPSRAAAPPRDPRLEHLGGLLSEFGLRPSATQEEVRKQFREHARKHHPDAGAPDDSEFKRFSSLRDDILRLMEELRLP